MGYIQRVRTIRQEKKLGPQAARLHETTDGQAEAGGPPAVPGKKEGKRPTPATSPAAYSTRWAAIKN